MRWIVVSAVVAMTVQIALALVIAPAAVGFSAPMTQRLLYYHVPAAWAAYVAFAATAAASAWYLWRRDRRADAVALAAAESGTLFSAIALATGLIWAGQEFVGYSALEDPKVISLVAVILSYLAYFVLRRSVAEPERRARLAAVFGLLALVGVPLSYLASRASLHPDFARPDESLDWRLGIVLAYSTLAFTLLVAALIETRYRLALVEGRREEEEGRRP